MHALLQVAFVNPCVTDLTLSDTRYLTPMILGIFSLSPVVKSMAWDRITLYVPQHAVGTGMYLGTTFLCPWPACEPSRRAAACALSLSRVVWTWQLRLAPHSPPAHGQRLGPESGRLALHCGQQQAHECASACFA